MKVPRDIKLKIRYRTRELPSIVPVIVESFNPLQFTYEGLLADLNRDKIYDVGKCPYCPFEAILLEITSSQPLPFLEESRLVGHDQDNVYMVGKVLASRGYIVDSEKMYAYKLDRELTGDSACSDGVCRYYLWFFNYLRDPWIFYDVVKKTDLNVGDVITGLAVYSCSLRNLLLDLWERMNEDDQT